MSTITPQVRIQIQTFLQSLPEHVDFSELRDVISKEITKEKTKRVCFCVLCENDVDKLMKITRSFKPYNLRTQIKDGALQIEPSVFDGFVCDNHAREYKLDKLIERMRAAKKVTSNNWQLKHEQKRIASLEKGGSK